MRKIALALTLLCTLAFTSCAAGPKYLERSLDDFDQKLYQDMPLVDGILWFPIPAFPFAKYIAYFGDFFINGYAFWFKDVWAGEGTGFEHADVVKDRKIKSLVRDDSAFLKFEGHD